MPNHVPDLLHHLDPHMGRTEYLERIELVSRGREMGWGSCERTPIVIAHHLVQIDILQ